jgi:hypothetical protein
MFCQAAVAQLPKKLVHGNRRRSIQLQYDGQVFNQSTQQVNKMFHPAQIA